MIEQRCGGTLSCVKKMCKYSHSQFHNILRMFFKICFIRRTNETGFNLLVVSLDVDLLKSE